MNKSIAFLAAAFLLAAGSACAETRKVILSVPTMDCDTCPITIRIALKKVPGVSNVVVSYARRNAKVTFDDTKTDVTALTKATEAAGYPSFQAD